VIASVEIENVMQEARGHGPAGMTCEQCGRLSTRTGSSRSEFNRHAQNHKPLTLFRCSLVSTNEHWSVRYAACGAFTRAW